MEKPVKFTLIAVIGSACIGVLIIYNLFLLPSATAPTIPGDTTTGGNGTTPNISDIKNITVSVDFKNGTIRTWKNINLTAGHGHAYNALLNGTTNVVIQWYGTDVFVKGIDGKMGGLTFEVNNFSPTVASNKYYLNDNDLVEWEFVS